MTMYELTAEYAALKALVDESMIDEEGNPKELDDHTRALLNEMADQWKSDFREKAERVCKFRANVIADADECIAQAKIMRAEADRLLAMAVSHTNKVKALNYLILTTMERIPVQKIQTATFLVYLQKNPPSMEVRDESKIPAKYFEVVPESLALKKAELKKDLVDGVLVEWVRPDAVEGVELTVNPGAVIIQETGVRVK